MVTDDSGQRPATLFRVLETVAKIYGLAREAGIVSIRYLNGRRSHSNITSDKIETVCDEIKFKGLTKIGTQLQEKILEPFVKSTMTKPLLVMVITDGNIDGENEGLLEKNIEKCFLGLEQDLEQTTDAVTFMFARIGEDQGAQDLLDSLVNSPNIARWIECLPVTYRLEQIGYRTLTQWTVLRRFLLSALYRDPVTVFDTPPVKVLRDIPTPSAPVVSDPESAHPSALAGGSAGSINLDGLENSTGSAESNALGRANTEPGSANGRPDSNGSAISTGSAESNAVGSANAEPRSANGRPDSNGSAVLNGSADSKIPASSNGQSEKPWTVVRMTAEKCAVKLKLFIQREKPGLLTFFPDYDVKKYALKGAEMVEGLVRYGCPREMAEQFAVLVLYDLVILLDDSSSMGSGADRKRENMLLEVLIAVASVYGLARDQGIVTVRFFNAPRGRKDVTRGKVEKLHGNIQYNGVSMIGTQLQEKILTKLVQAPKAIMAKPLLTIIMTDGNIEGEKDGLLKKYINNCLAKLDADKTKTVDAVAFMFARIGEDQGGRKLIEELDNDQKLGPWIDCLPVDSSLEDIGDLRVFDGLEENSSQKGIDSQELEKRRIRRLTRWGVVRKLLLGALYAEIDKMDEDEGVRDEDFMKFQPEVKDGNESDGNESDDY
ncbi:hypothetical protein BZA05DRAFT_412948 [Tricharina praecox]|uniref:uncharacterized protein n=1 Tax=Tricharina praecox TaxID=43433 RepID=UPI0022208774|nr:uncharacterized protein BZA05DRAFT_412948 [Tricharina praecox]KAI5841687.1 hypothetical protein BZA05DRAFT_412948 [Tricharina praecox]